MNGLDYLIFTGLLILAICIDDLIVKFSDKRGKK